MSRRGENIRKRTDGRWEGRVKKTAAPYSKYKSFYGKTYAEVKEKMKSYVIEEDTLKETCEDCFDKYADIWLAEIQSTRKYSTYIKYENIYLKYLKNFLKNMKADVITEKKCTEYLMEIYYTNENQHLSINTMNIIKYVLNQIFITAGNKLEITLPKIILCENKFNKKEISILSLDEQNRLIAFLLNDIDIYKAGILICLFSGLRLGEICALENQNINISGKSLKITQTVQRIKLKNKGKTELLCTTPKSVSSYREVPLCDFILDILNNIEIKGIYFLEKNKPMEPRTYQYKFKEYLKQAGIKNRNFHVIRHTFATNCIANGMDIKCLSEILGHSDVKTTMNKYIHPSMDSKREQLNKCISINGQ